MEKYISLVKVYLEKGIEMKWIQGFTSALVILEGYCLLFSQVSLDFFWLTILIFCFGLIAGKRFL